MNNSTTTVWRFPASQLNEWAKKLDLIITLSPADKNPDVNGYYVRVQKLISVDVPWQNVPMSAKVSVGPLPAPTLSDQPDIMLSAWAETYIYDALNELTADLRGYDWVFPHADAKALFVQRLQGMWSNRAKTGQAQECWLDSKREWEAEVNLLRLSQDLKMDDYPSMYPRAKSMDRKFTVILGPTNSGKTHRAIQLLKASPTGVYLGPLRLLALEIQERLVSEGTPCSLLTGEERVDIPGAGHRASTVEMMDPDIPVDVAVIDEVQMLTDERGWAWTSAIVGLPARHMILVGSPDIWPVLRSLLERLNVEPEVIRVDRLQALKVEKEAIDVDGAQEGDAFIVFSRKDVFLTQELLAKRGLSTSVIYGSLGPEVRRSEAKRFRDGTAKVLIATDAVGMGLNLPIRRVIITSDSKFNGTDVALIDPSLIKQISGRAGRYGHFDEGSVSGTTPEIRTYIAHALGKSTKIPEQTVPVAPTVDQLLLLAEGMAIPTASIALRAWRTEFLRQDENFHAAELNERVLLAQDLEKRFPSMEMADVAAFSMAPLPRDSVVYEAFMVWMGLYVRSAKQYKQGLILDPIPWEDTLDNDFSLDAQGIQIAESKYHVASLYCWLSRQRHKYFPHDEQAQEARSTVAKTLIDLLQMRAKRLVNQKTTGRINKK